jgi:hypothetical protein
MYRNLWFQLIFENIYRILLFLFITHSCFSKILFCSYKNDYLIINNKIIRETISSKDIISYFAVDVPHTNYITTHDVSACTLLDEHPLTKYHFKDHLVKNTTLSLGKFNYTSGLEHIFNIVGIFKSTPLSIIEPPLFIKVYYDGKVVLSNELNYNYNTISFYEELLSTSGYHTFEIIVKSKGIWCLCPNKGSGYENNKYFFAWINSYPIFESYSQLLKIKNNEYSIII